MKQTTRFSLSRGWKVLMSDLGINPSDVLTLAALPADLFAHQHAALSPAEYFRIWHALDQLTGSVELPLKLAHALSSETFDPPIFAYLCSPNLNIGLQRLQQFKALLGPLSLKIDINPMQTSLAITCYGHDTPIPLSLGISELIFFTYLARIATRQHIIPLWLELPSLPDDPTPYLDYFGTPIRRGDNIRLAFSARDAARPFLTEDATMWEFFEQGLSRKLSQLDSDATTTQRVHSILLEMLPSGHSNIDEAAQRLALSKRSLQRKLHAEATSYYDILSTVRLELAQHYLTRSTISLGEIAYLIGFQDSNSFLRAFKNWTALTPMDYRQHHTLST